MSDGDVRRRARAADRGTPDLDAVSDQVEPSNPAPLAVEVPPEPAPPAARTEAPSPDVVPAPLTSRMPGAPRDGYHHLPTAPVIVATTGPDVDEAPTWEPSGYSSEPRSSIAPWALGLAILALVISMFVGWMLPLGAVAVIAAIIALRRLGESRSVAIWALVLGAVAVVYSAGWLIWAIPQLAA